MLEQSDSLENVFRELKSILASSSDFVFRNNSYQNEIGHVLIISFSLTLVFICF